MNICICNDTKKSNSCKFYFIKCQISPSSLEILSKFFDASNNNCSEFRFLNSIFLFFHFDKCFALANRLSVFDHIYRFGRPIKCTQSETGWACARHRWSKKYIWCIIASFLVDRILGRHGIQKWRSAMASIKQDAELPANGFDIEIKNHKWMLCTHARSLSFTRRLARCCWTVAGEMRITHSLHTQKSIACAVRIANCNLLCIKLWSRSEPLLALWCIPSAVMVARCGSYSFSLFFFLDLPQSFNWISLGFVLIASLQRK